MEATRRYSPPDVLKIEKQAVKGNPDMRLVSTSYVEKQNHTVRMHCRRLSRLTNAFSKKRENFDGAIALHYAYYNFCKRHATIRCTPAQETGVADSQWTTGRALYVSECAQTHLAALVAVPARKPTGTEDLLSDCQSLLNYLTK